MNPLAAEDRIAKPAPRTMPDLGIGKIITTDQPREAIHIAVAPVRAARYLAPGAPVALDDKAEAVNWITSFAQRCEGVSYLQIMDAAADYIEHGEYWSQGDRFEGCYVPDEFWTHYQTITGKAASDRGSFFSCSC